MAHKASLKARASAKGQPKGAYAEANIHADSTVGKLARLHYTMDHAMVHGDGKSTMKSPGDKRTPGQKLYQVG